MARKIKEMGAICFQRQIPKFIKDLAMQKKRATR